MLNIVLYLLSYRAATTNGQQDSSHEYGDSSSDGVYCEITSTGKKEYSMRECAAYISTSEDPAVMQEDN